MSDKDTSHTLAELQEARAEIDRLREVVMEYKRMAAKLVGRVAELDELMRWRKADEETPEDGSYCVITLRNMDWPNVIRFHSNTLWDWTVITHWRPIGPLPGGE